MPDQSLPPVEPGAHAAAVTPPAGATLVATPVGQPGTHDETGRAPAGVPSPSPAPWRPRRAVPTLIARVLLTAAALILLHTIFDGTRWVATVVALFSGFVFPIGGSGIGLVVFYGVLAVALQRRKRGAWTLAVITFSLMWLTSVAVFAVLLVEVLGHWQPNPPIDVTISPQVFNVFSIGVLLVLLLTHRGDFEARTARGNVRRALLTLIGGLAISASVGTAIAMMFGGRAHPRSRTFELLRRVVLGSSAGSVPGVPRWGQMLVSLLVGLSLLVALLVLLRSQQAAATMALDDELDIRRLLRQNPDSLSYFATRRDKAVVFSPRRDAAIAYRSQLGVCLAAGDPLGARDHWPGAINQFLAHARRYGLSPAVVGASEAGATAFTAAGMRALRVGDEAVLRPAQFDLAARGMKPVAATVQRLERLGYTVLVRRHRDIPADELRRIIHDTDAWRSTDEERGFSMALGRLGDPLDGDCLMVQALFPADRTPGAGDSVDRTAGVLSFVPWGRRGCSLDVMRRSPQADNGVTELMVAGLMAQGRDAGIDEVSLNFAVFRSALEEGARVGATPVQRMQRRLLMVASRWFQIEQLYRSNVKYEPEWQPRFLCYDDPSDIANVGLALGVAEGYIPLPSRLDPVPPQELVSADDPRVRAWLEEEATLPEVETRRVPEQVARRMSERERLLDAGLQAYPVETGVTASCASVATASDAPAGDPITIGGRIMGISDHGGVVFCRLQDWSGRTQALLDAATLGRDELHRFTHTVGLGDQVAFTGVRGASGTGTPSLLVSGWRLTSKSLRPLPSKYKPISDPEARVRQRYLDLMTSPASRGRLRARSTAIQAVRQTMLDHDYLEVETPILQTIHGGANARPFRTHINAYDLDLYLRIAPELYLKRLMVGGLDRVFEIGRNFRNEGADATHNPEFTVIEAYQANGTYHSMRDLTVELVRRAALAANGTTVVRGRGPDGQQHEVDLAEPWRWVSVHEAISEGLGEQVTPDTTREELVRHCTRLGIETDARQNRGQVLDELYDVFCESRTVAPTFFCDFPAETSPLTRPHRDDPRLAERWDLVVFGSELGTAYSELVDPVIQRQRLTAQSLQAAGGDPEAMEIDEDFLTALEYGMPPTGGLGIGLDRLVMMLVGAPIRETITFPLVRPRKI